MHMEIKLLEIIARLTRSSERNKVYEMRAKKDNRPELAKLFHAIADSHAMQAKRFLMQVRGAVGTTDENEKTAFTEDIPATIREYQLLMKEADLEDSRALSTGYRHSGEVEKHHLEIYNSLDEQRQDTEYYVCDFCGYVAEGEPPDNCPVCTAPKNRFKKV